MAPTLPDAPDWRTARQSRGRLGRRRQAAWERATRQALDERSEGFYERIEQGGTEWLGELI
jgi:hypothetical protein